MPSELFRWRHLQEQRLSIFTSPDCFFFFRRIGDYPFIDSRNIGVWGWGYGGYLTIKALSQPLGLLRCGAAVSPISVWHRYNPLLAHRYLGNLGINTWDQYSRADLTRYCSPTLLVKVRR